jgi:VCBS repeat-containing protein
MPVTIITKNNSSAGVVPSAGQLVQGELAVNVTDKRLYSLDSLGNVILLAAGSNYIEPVTIVVTDNANPAVTVTQNGNGGAAVFNNAGSGAAVRITQTGAGNALVVEDSPNPDSTPVVIDQNGYIIQGNTASVLIDGVSPRIQLHTLATSNRAGFASYNWSAGSSPPGLNFAKSRSATIGTLGGIVASGDNLGAIFAYGDDGVSFIPATSISSIVDGTPGINSMPGRLAFSTTAIGASTPTERMRIVSSGRVGIGTASPTELLDVNGNVAITGSARRITGDFSNATVASRVMFQSNTTNGATNVAAIPNGSSTSSSLQANNAADPANASQIYLSASATLMQVVSDKTGTGTYLPLTFLAGGAESFRVDTTQRLIVQKASNGALTALTSSAGSIAVNLNLGNNFTHTTTENTTLANPTNMTAGQYGVIVITQGATPRTMAFGSYWDFQNGTVPALTPTASAVDVIAFYVASATKIIANFLQDVK